MIRVIVNVLTCQLVLGGIVLPDPYHINPVLPPFHGSEIPHWDGPRLRTAHYIANKEVRIE